MTRPTTRWAVRRARPAVIASSSSSSSPLPPEKPMIIQADSDSDFDSSDGETGPAAGPSTGPRHQLHWHFPTQHMFAANHVVSATPSDNQDKSEDEQTTAMDVATGDEVGSEGDDDDDDDAEIFELPPGNQQAVPRAFLLEVAPTPTNSASNFGPSADRTQRAGGSSPLQNKAHTFTRTTSASSFSSSGSSLSSASLSSGTNEADAHNHAMRLLPNLSLSSPYVGIAVDKGKARAISASQGSSSDNDIGQGSLDRGIVVPSSDHEDELDSDDEPEVGDKPRYGAGVFNRNESLTRAHHVKSLSTQALLNRPLPAFCRAILAGRERAGQQDSHTRADLVVAATQHADAGLSSDDDLAEESDMYSQVRPRSQRSPVHRETHKSVPVGGRSAEVKHARSSQPRATEPHTAAKSPSQEALRNAGANAAGNEVEAEYDEEAHLRDSAAAADETLIVQPRSSAQRSRHKRRDRLSHSPTESGPSSRSATTVPDSQDVIERPRDESPKSGRVALTPPPPLNPVPDLKALANQFAFDPLREHRGFFEQQAASGAEASTSKLPQAQPNPPQKLEARAEQCVFIQIMPWHARLGTKAGRGRGRGRGRGGAGAGAQQTRLGGSYKGKAKATDEAEGGEKKEVALVDSVDLGAEVVDLSAIPLELVRPLEACPICAVPFPKSRTGPAKRGHMESCARHPPPAARDLEGQATDHISELGAADRSASKEGQGTSSMKQSAESGAAATAGPVQNSESIATGTSAIPQCAPLTPVQVHALIAAEVELLIAAERARIAARDASKTLFAQVVGDEAAAEAARAAQQAKEARERERRVHLDNMYQGQGELPRDYKPRKKRKRRGASTSPRKGGGAAEGGGGEGNGDEVGLNRSLVRLMARKDAEAARRRQAVLKSRSAGVEGEGAEGGLCYDEEAARAEELMAQVLAGDGSALPASLWDDCADDETASLASTSRVSRSESRSPTKSTASSSTAASTTFKAASAQQLAEQLGTTLIPAREGRARAAAFLHEELFPPTQLPRSATAAAPDHGLVPSASLLLHSDYVGGRLHPGEAVKTALRGLSPNKKRRRLSDTHWSEDPTSPSPLQARDDNVDANDEEDASGAGMQDGPDDRAQAGKDMSAALGWASSPYKASAGARSGSRSMQADAEVDDDDDDDAVEILPGRPAWLGSASSSAVAMPPATQRFRRSRLADKYNGAGRGASASSSSVDLLSGHAAAR